MTLFIWAQKVMTVKAIAAHHQARVQVPERREFRVEADTRKLESIDRAIRGSGVFGDTLITTDHLNGSPVLRIILEPTAFDVAVAFRRLKREGSDPQGLL